MWDWLWLLIPVLVLWWLDRRSDGWISFQHAEPVEHRPDCLSFRPPRQSLQPGDLTYWGTCSCEVQRR